LDHQPESFANVSLASLGRFGFLRLGLSPETSEDHFKSYHIAFDRLIANELYSIPIRLNRFSHIGYRSVRQRALDLGDCRAMHNGNEFNDELMSLGQHELLKQALLRLLDDPEIRQKIGVLSRRSGRTASKGINVPERWSA